MAETINVGVLRALLTLDSATFESGMREASGSAKKFASDMGKLGSNLSGLGTRLTASVTLPIVGAFGAASKAAIDFESSFAGVRKTVEASEADFKVMEQQFRGLAKTIPVSVNELNKLGEAAGALGIPKEEIVDFARVMAELGVTTNLTAEQAADSIARIQNIFGAAGQDTERLASTIVALGNAGASTEAEITEMAQRIAGAGHTIGLTQAQVVGFASTLASVGINAEAGGSAISRVFLKMNDAVMAGGKGLEAFATVAGVSGASFKQAFEKDAAQATVSFINGLARMKAEGQNINAVIEGLTGKNIILKDTLLRLVGAGGELSRQLGVANTAWKENTALTEEARKRFETTEQKLVLLWNKLKDVAITFGNALLPAINTAIGAFDKLLPYIDRAVKWFGELPGPVQAFVIAVAGIAAAAGPVLFLFGQLATAVGTLAGIGGFSGLIASIGKLVGLSGFGGLTTALTAVRTALGVLMGPWGLVVAAAVVLAPVLWDMVGGWDGIKDALGRVWTAIQPVVQFLGDLATIGWHIAKVVLSALGEAFMWVVGVVEKVFHAINDWVIQPLRDFEKMVFDATGVNWFFDQIKWAAGKASEAVEELALDIKNAADVATQIAKATKELANTGFNKQVAGNAFKAPDISELEAWEAGLNKVKEPLKAVATLTADADEKTKKAKWSTEDWALAMEKVRDKMKAIAFEGYKTILKEERKTAEETADAWLKSFNVRTQAERDLTRITRQNGFDRAQAEIDYAKQHGATWQQLYAMERRLADARLQAAIDDAEMEFRIRTAGMDRTTAHGEAAYQALKAAHDAAISGMVENHQRSEAMKRDELERTHDVWRRSLENIKALWYDLSNIISQNLSNALMNATSFKDAFVGIWQSIKQSLLNIFADILNSFIKGLLDGMLGAIMGRSGAFSQAFSGVLGGIGIPGLGGGAAGAGAAGAGAAGAGAAGAGAGAAGAGGGGSAAGVGGGIGLGATVGLTAGIGGAALLAWAIWKKGLFRGGEEALKVSPARDEFFKTFQDKFGGSQFESMAAAFADAGVSGDIAEKLIKALYDADTMKEFQAATDAIGEALAGASTSANQTAEGIAKTSAALQQFNATIDKLEMMGTVSEEAINALRSQIQDLSATASPEIIAQLNATLQQMISSGSVSDEMVQKLVSTIAQMSQQTKDTTTTTDDLTGASTDLEKQFDRNCWMTLEMRNRLAELEQISGSAEEAWRRLSEEMAQPIDIEINVPTINLGEYMNGPTGEIPSFANEGIVRSPMLAMVGDAKEPEWILHQSSVMDMARRAFSLGAFAGNQADGLDGAVPRSSSAGRDGGVQIGSLSVTVNSASGNAQTLARELLAAIPQAMRMDHNLVRQIRGAVA